MRYINLFYIAIGLFAVGLAVSLISMFVGDAARLPVALAGALLNGAGWITYIIGLIKR